MKKLSRAVFLRILTISLFAHMMGSMASAQIKTFSSGPFEPTITSLSNYQVPEWFRDAKFGIWAHWGPQCEPEAGDWYARNMYIQGSKQYDLHLKRYGHPSKFGFKDVIHLWKAEHFDPGQLMALYKNAGAKYFVALANHHDNFDLWDSKYQPWNAVNMGPQKNLIGKWAEAAKKAGLRFGVSVHASSAWSWYEVTQLKDTSGAFKGVSYDGVMSKADGKGLWWEGYDPQDLYAQYGHKISKDVLNRRLAWQNPGDLPSAAYLHKFYDRVKDLVSRYEPDLVYFDDSHLPLYENDPSIGLNLAAGLYNKSIAKYGRNEAVINTKSLTDTEKKCFINDLEVGTERQLSNIPWQSDACIGAWHYKKDIEYKNAESVIHALIDVVSKNGNLLLSIPIRADGTIDDKEKEILKGIGAWLAINGEAIYGTRPWVRYGEGPSIADHVPDNAKGHMPLYRKAPYVAQDFRFTTKGKSLYAIAMARPSSGKLLIRSITALPGSASAIRISLLGSDKKLSFQQTAEGLEVMLPAAIPDQIAYTLRIDGYL
ncbi:alpha-L-fucosidase [Mucilaginibacter sp. RS28]|uniref:alpha-L-fucosidase n=1 Tax=Mucilaginibacter straminoryzae TaxID=2932774 RepID=A0A9X2BC75_9SPHI|nr:alpha-L-fucosidase [Mucilaginibacter straminoryzae]MCJ8208998.1 alpha-L-fucosidase [Mucilaginibacter straminoryzae]